MTSQSTKEFHAAAGVNATSKDALSKLVKAWESKNAQRAVRGAGLGLMAVSLAACGGGGGSTGTDGSSDDGIERIGETFSLTQLPAITTGEVVLPDGLSLTGDLAAFIEALAAANQGAQAQFLKVTGTADNDTFLGDAYAIHGIDIRAGSGTDTLIIDMKGPWAQPAVLDSVEVVNVVNNANEYLDTKMLGWDWTEIDGVPVGLGESVLDLFGARNLTDLIVSEGSFGVFGGLEVRNILATADIELEGSFFNDVELTFMGGAGALDITLQDVFLEGATVNVAHNASIINLVSTSTEADGVNDMDGVVFGDLPDSQLSTLNVSGDADLQTGVLNFDDDRSAVLNASSLQANLTAVIESRDDFTFRGATGANDLTVSGADVNGETRLVLNASFAGSNGTNDSITVVTDNVTTYLEGNITAADGVELIVTGDGTLDATRLTSVNGIDKVVFADAAAGLELTAAQVNGIGIANFETADFVNANGNLTIVDVTSSTALNLSAIDNGDLAVVRTADGQDVTLSATTVLGNLRDGVAEIEILAESGDSSLTMTAAQFQQLDGTGTISVVGLGEAATGNDPETNTPFEGSLTITDVASDTVIDLAAVDVDGVTIEVGSVGGTFVADGLRIVEGGADDVVTLEISGDVDLTDAILTGVDAIVLVGGATLTTSSAFLQGIDISGVGTINIDGNTLTLDSEGNDYALADIDLVFTSAGGAVLTVQGDADVTIQSVQTGADVTSLVINNDLDAGRTLTVTGASPAIVLGGETTELEINVGADNFTVIGTESDEVETLDVVEPAITGSALSVIDINNRITDNQYPSATVNLGVVGGVADNLVIDARNFNPGDAAVLVQFDEIPSSADWTILNGAITINDGANIGEGASLTIDNGTTIGGSIDYDTLPIAADSSILLSADYSAAEIAALLQNLAGATATVDVTGMTAEQLSAVAGASEKIAGLTGVLFIDSSLSAEDITILAALPSDGLTGFNAVLTGMSNDQLSALGNALDGQPAPGALSGTFTLSNTIDGWQDLLASATRSSNITIDATDMDAADLAALYNNIASIDTLENLTYVSTGDALIARALLNATTDANVDGTGLSGAEKLAIAENIGKVADAGIVDLEITSADSASTISALLSKAVDAQVSAGGMSDAQLAAVAGGVAGVAADGIANLLITDGVSAADITALLGAAEGTTSFVDLTDLSEEQVDAVAGSIDQVNAVGGETTAAVLVQLDTADTFTLDANGVTLIAGSAAELADIIDRADEIGPNSIELDFNGWFGEDGAVDFALTDEAGSTLSIEDLTALQGATEGEILVQNAVDIEGTQNELATALLGPGTTIDATAANLFVTDAVDADALDAAVLGELDDVSGTVTIVNDTAIRGTIAELTATVVNGNVVAPASNMIIEVGDIGAGTGQTDQQLIEDIDVTTTGSITVESDGFDNELDFTGYGIVEATGLPRDGAGGLIIDAGFGADTVIGSQFDDTIVVDGFGGDVGEGESIDGGDGDDTLQVSGWVDLRDPLNEVTSIEAVALGTEGELYLNASELADNAITSVTGTAAVGDAPEFVERLELYGTDAANTITLAGITTITGAVVAVYAGLENDSVTGSAFADELHGEDGNDTLIGGDGADTLDGGNGNDSLVGGNGGDIFYVGGGLNTVDINEDETRITSITSGGSAAGVDVIYGLDRDDIVDVAGTGFVSATAQTVESVASGSIANSITQGTVNVYQGSLAADGTFTVSSAEGADDYLVQFGDGNEVNSVIFADLDDVGLSFTVSTDGKFSLVTGGSTEIVPPDTTGGAAGLFLGGPGPDDFVGGTGNDTMIGLSGFDTLDGGAGNDSLDGGNQPDLLIGGAGDDTLTGGEFDDTFEFGVSFGNDVITDFSVADGDVLNFEAFDINQVGTVTTLGGVALVDNRVVVLDEGTTARNAAEIEALFEALTEDDANVANVAYDSIVITYTSADQTLAKVYSVVTTDAPVDGGVSSTATLIGSIDLTVNWSTLTVDNFDLTVAVV